MLVLKIYIIGFVVTFCLYFLIELLSGDTITGYDLMEHIIPLSITSWFGFLYIIFSFIIVIDEIIRNSDWYHNVCNKIIIKR